MILTSYILLAIALILSSILFPIGWMYSLLTFRVKKRNLHLYVYRIALSIDQLGNVVCSNLFNDLLRKEGGYNFGNEDETISKVLGVNKASGHLTKLGKFLADILNKIDPNHVEKAAKEY